MKPCISISIIVTKEAIITMYEGILILSGMNFLTREIVMFDIARTAVVASPMPRPFSALVVVARVGHIPRT
jgi:hypothetical protein